MMAAGELRRVRNGTSPDDKLNGYGTDDFVVRCAGNAEAVLGKAKEAIEIVLRYGADDWPSDAQWPSLLPAWFVAACAPESSAEQLDRELESWRKLSFEEKAALARTERWSALTWVFWMHPNERCWWWWDARVRGPNDLVVTSVTDGWPFDSGALDWLMRASGGLEFDEDPMQTKLAMEKRVSARRWWIFWRH